MSRLALLSHATMTIDVGDLVILTDPWFSGTAFNDSWRLLREPTVTDEMLAQVTHVWISHEHPDHFHVGTLRALPEELKRRATVLIRDDNSDKMRRALEGLGFATIESLTHRRTVQRGRAELYSYQVGQMDSILAVRETGAASWWVNVNDAELSASDATRIRSDLGAVSLLASQFSTAGYDGRPDPQRHLPGEAVAVLDRMVAVHRSLGASVTLPIASHVRFCTTDNAHLNEFANRPSNVVERFASEGLAIAVLGPGDALDESSLVLGDLPDASATWEAIFEQASRLEPDASPLVPLEAITSAAAEWAADLRRTYPRALLRPMPNVDVRIADLDEQITLHPLPRARPRDPDCCVTLNSEPLHFMLAHPFGLQTLGVSGRLTVTGDLAKWRRLRALMSLRNAEIFLTPRLFLRRRNLAYLVRRLPGLVQQIRHRRRLM